MKNITVNLDPNNPQVKLDTYVSDVSFPKRPAMLVIPGGGYSCVCSDREGEPIALAFTARGMNAFVLHYTVKPADPYKPLSDASLAMKWIREHAEELSVISEKIYVVGFSAGGHLAATLGTMWNDEHLNEMTGIKFGVNRPAGMILCYPVISASGHPGSFKNLLGAEFENTELRHAFSANERVSEHTCPAFIVHTASDDVVPVKNALEMAEALSEHGIPFELHIYPKGPHGMALANSDTNMGKSELTDTAYARWVDDVMIWMSRNL